MNIMLSLKSYRGERITQGNREVWYLPWLACIIDCRIELGSYFPFLLLFNYLFMFDTWKFIDWIDSLKPMNGKQKMLERNKRLCLDRVSTKPTYKMLSERYSITPDRCKQIFDKYVQLFSYEMRHSEDRWSTEDFIRTSIYSK